MSVATKGRAAVILVLVMLVGLVSLAAPSLIVFRFPLEQWVETCGFKEHCWQDNHLGDDAKAGADTLVLSPATGVVKEAQFHNGYGGTVVIEASNGSQTITIVIGHLRWKKPGDLLVGRGPITFGTPIGRVAPTGENGGGYAPHAHIGVHRGAYVSGAASLITCGTETEWAYAGYTNCPMSVFDDWVDPSDFINLLRAPVIVDASISPNQGSPGSTISFIYRIENTLTSDIDVRLGASVRKFGTSQWVDDPSRDRVVRIPSGAVDASRDFVLPSFLQDGLYDIAWTLLSEDGSSTFARREDRSILIIQAPPPPPPVVPSCSLLAVAPAIPAGGSSTLSWTTAGNPTSASIDSGVGLVDTTGGSFVVSPSASTTYTMTVTSSAGSGTCSSALIVAARVLRVPQDFATPQGAIDACQNGDVIVIAPGLYVIPGRPFTLANGVGVSVGLPLCNGSTLLGSGPAQTVFEFPGADIGVVLQNGTATVKLLHLRKVPNHVFSYVGSNMTVTNVIMTEGVANGPGDCCIGLELNQGTTYTARNNTIDNLHFPVGTRGTGIDVPFGGVADVQNNLVTNNDRAFTAGSFTGGMYTFNDAFGSPISDWAICTAAGCTPVSAPPNNLSTDPLFCADYTLQSGSPALNAGNPSVLNRNGTRSDLGAFGGPDAIMPPLVASPCVVDFGDVPVGTIASPITVTLRSTLSTDQTITAISRDNTAFDVIGSPLGVVGPLGTVSFTVTFSPPQAGAVTGEVQVSTSDPFPTRIKVRGRGI